MDNLATINQSSRCITQDIYNTEKFADIDKKAWIFILIALILGFFMGKTMQPIILRSV